MLTAAPVLIAEVSLLLSCPFVMEKHGEAFLSGNAMCKLNDGRLDWTPFVLLALIS